MRRKNEPFHRLWQPRLESLEPRLVPANVDVLSYHNDLLLTGQNLQETVLHPGPASDPTALNVNNFGKLFTQPVDGQVYAQPLYKANLLIPGRGTHNVAFVATEHDSVYAFDTDSNQGANAAPLWKASLIDPANGVTPMPSGDIAEINIVPELGITGTPVIDGATNTLYVVTCTKEVVGGVTHYRQKLHALDLATGAEKFGGPSTFGDSVPTGDGGFTDTSSIVVDGRGDGADAMGRVRFSAAKELQRPALQLVGGVVYVAWASHADIRPYHGWVVGFDKTSLQPVKWFNTAPNAGGVGVWQSGGGVSADAQGNLYFAVGNGFDGPDSAFDPSHGNYSESVLKLSTTGQLSVADYFTPYDWQALDDRDADLGSGGAMLLPDFVGSTAHPHLMVETGKSGKIYLIDRDSMGHNVPPPGPDRVVQVVTAGQQGVWGNPAFFKVNATTGIIYYHGQGDVLKGYTITNGHIDDTPADIQKSSFLSGFPGTQPTVSADATADPNNPANGIVWEVQVDQFAGGGPAILRAFSATNLSQSLYDSSQLGLRDQFGAAVRFTVPVVTNGHVLVASQTSFAVFGLFPQANAVPAPCTNLQGGLQAGPRGPQIQLTWTNPAPNPGADPTSIAVLRSTNGTDFSLLTFVDRNTTTYTDPGPFVIGQRYYYGILAFNQKGNSAPSNIVNVLVPVAAPVLTVTGTGASSIGLAWTAVANDHYEVERSADGVNFTRVATVPAFQTSYTDTGLAAGAYAYRVHAFNANPVGDSLSNVRGTWVGPVIDHANGFPTAFDLTANGSAFISPTEHLIRLTDSNSQTGSVFANTPITVAKFTASFQVFIHEGTQPDYADGFTFTIQANAPTALGQGNGGLGYQGIGHSVAVKFSTFQHTGDPSSSSTGLVLNGASPSGGVSTVPSGVLLNSQNRKQIDLAYDGTTLTETITDIVRGTSFSTSFAVNLPQVLGSDTAYVGFTGATGTGNFWEIEDVLNWRFTSQAVLPGAPANLRQTAFASSAVDLAWDGRSSNETGYQVERSLDGTTFTPVGTTTATSFEDNGLPIGTYYYRVKAVNAQGSSPYSGTLTVSLPGALLTQDQDIGSPGDPTFPGSASFFNGTYTLTASGSDIGNPDDHFHFLYRPVLGDGELIARLVTEGAGNGIPEAGVMFRQDLTKDSPNAFMLQFPPGMGSPNAPDFQWRPNVGDITLEHQAPQDTASPPVWLRLVRSGFTFSGYWARDTGNGTHGPWNLLGSEAVNINPSAFIGLALSARSSFGAPATATFDHVQFTPALQPASHLDVSASGGPGIPGVPVTITVTALDPFNNPVPGYRGTVHFISSDAQAVLPADYTFTAADNGTHTFRVTLGTVGRQTVLVTDTATPVVRGGTQVPFVYNPPPVVTVDYAGGFANHTLLTATGSAAFPGAGTPVGVFTAHEDVNIPVNEEPAGSASFNAGTGAYTLTAGGLTIGGTSDQFHYAYRPFGGDGEVVARVVSMSATDYFTQAGLMIRDNLSAGSPNVFMGEFGPGGDHNAPFYQWRMDQGGPTMLFDTAEGTQPPPVWLRLVRSGNTFTGYWAQDVNNGQDHGPWQQLEEETVALPANVFVGLALSANTFGFAARATFDHVSVTSATVPPTPARLTDPVSGQAGAVVTRSRVGVAAFNTTFTFQLRALGDPVADGLTFVIHNDPRGPAALSTTAGGLGYGGPAGVRNSVAIKFDSWKPTGNHSSTGLYFDGHFPANDNGPPDVVVDLGGTGIDFAAAARATPPHSFHVDLSYDGTTLTETIKDLTTNATFSHAYTVDIPAAVGGPAAYVGFTADAGGPNLQDVQTWTGQFAVSGPATHLAVNTAAATTAGAPLTVTVTVLDRNNNQAFGYTGTVHFTSTDGQAGLPADYTFTPADQGQHTFTVTLKTAGTQTLTVADTMTPSIRGSQSGIMVSPAALSKLLVAGFPSPSTAGVAGTFAVAATDAYGNTIVGYRGTVHFSSSDGQAVLPADYTFTGTDNGQHTFTATLKTAGTQSLTAADAVTGSLSGTQAGIQVVAAAADHLDLTAPASVPTHTPFALTVAARDPFGNLVTAYRGTVHFSSTDPQAGLPADYPFTPGDAGQHAFSVTLTTPGSQTVTAADAGSPAVIGSATVTVTRQLFYPAVDYPVDAGPHGVAVADFTGDGVPDLAVASSDGNTITLLLGQGDGTFQPGGSLATDAYPLALVVADLNGDGVPDLVVANRDGGTLTVFLGNGDGTFQPAQSVPLGFAPMALAVADLNGDGVPDLVVADPGDAAVATLLGVGDGTFQPPVFSPAGAAVGFVAVADFNGDGVPDVVTADPAGGTVSVLLGVGDGSFQGDAGRVYAVGTAPVQVVVADLNGDGVPDLAVANQGDNTVSVLLGNGDGSFQPAVSFAVGTAPLGIAVGDFNGDGVPDLAVANQGDGSVSVLLGNGDGSFQPAVSFAVGAGPAAVAVADLNGDQAADLVTANADAGTVSVLLNAVDWPMAPEPGHVASRGKARLYSTAALSVTPAPQSLFVGDRIGASGSLRPNQTASAVDQFFTDHTATARPGVWDGQADIIVSRWAEGHRPSDVEREEALLPFWPGLEDLIPLFEFPDVYHVLAGAAGRRR